MQKQPFFKKNHAAHLGKYDRAGFHALLQILKQITQIDIREIAFHDAGSLALTLDPPEERFDPRNQQPGITGFGDIIVGAEFQSLDFMKILFLTRQEQYRNILEPGFLPDGI